MMGNKNFAKYLIVIVLGLVAGFYFANLQNNNIQEEIIYPEQFSLLSPAKDLKEFSLINHDNASFSKKSLMGKWSLVFFGYTSCPDICPTTLQTLANSYKNIIALNTKNPVQVIFVSIDPGRDRLQNKPDKLKDYISFFHHDFIAVSGEHKKLKELTRQLGAAYEVKKSSDSKKYEKAKYDVAHTSIIFVLNPQAQFAGFIRPPHTSEIIIKTLRSLTRNATTTGM